jgi:hypothetical protein
MHAGPRACQQTSPTSFCHTASRYMAHQLLQPVAGTQLCYNSTCQSCISCVGSSHQQSYIYISVLRSASSTVCTIKTSSSRCVLLLCHASPHVSAACQLFVAVPVCACGLLMPGFGACAGVLGEVLQVLGRGDEGGAHEAREACAGA